MTINGMELGASYKDLTWNNYSWLRQTIKQGFILKRGDRHLAYKIAGSEECGEESLEKGMNFLARGHVVMPRRNVIVASWPSDNWSP